MQDKSHKKEEVLYSFRPSPLMMALNLITGVLFFMIPFWIVLSGSGNLLISMLIGLMVSFVIGFQFWKHAIGLIFTECNLYNTQIEVKTGWIHLYRRIVSYDKIADIAYDQHLHDRIFGVGDIIITTTSIHHDRMDLPDIANPAKRYRKIRKIVSKQSKMIEEESKD